MTLCLFGDSIINVVRSSAYYYVISFIRFPRWLNFGKKRYISLCLFFSFCLKCLNKALEEQNARQALKCMLLYISTKKKEAILSIATYVFVWFSLIVCLLSYILKEEPFAISEGFLFAQKHIDNDLYMI